MDAPRVLQQQQPESTTTTTTTRESQLEIIRDEVGESYSERQRIHSPLKQQQDECGLEVYRRHIEEANRCKAHLNQILAQHQDALAEIFSVLGVDSHLLEQFQHPANLKHEIAHIESYLEAMRKAKFETIKQFEDVLKQIRELSGSTDHLVVDVDESDLSVDKLTELEAQLEEVKKRTYDQMFDKRHTLFSLCKVLGMDDETTMNEVDPDLWDDAMHFNFYRKPKSNLNISIGTLHKLNASIHKYQEIEEQRSVKYQDLATTMLKLWDILGTPVDEQQLFENVTRWVAAYPWIISEPGILSSDSLNSVETEVSRLKALQLSRLKGDDSSPMEYLIEAIKSYTAEVDPTLCEDEGGAKEKLRDLATTMLELWDYLKTPNEERQLFQHVITKPGNTLPLHVLNSVETEVSRLKKLKTSRLKELILKKRLELEEICRKATHMAIESESQMQYYYGPMNAGVLHPKAVLERLEQQLDDAKEEVHILQNVEEWLLVREVESRLKANNRNNARTSVEHTRRARALAKEIPAMVETLTSKTNSWEKKRGCELTYNGIRVLSLLDEYAKSEETEILGRKRKQDQLNHCQDDRPAGGLFGMAVNGRDLDSPMKCRQFSIPAETMFKALDDMRRRSMELIP